MTVEIRRLDAGDVEVMRDLNRLFARVFADPDSYQSRPPGETYLQRVLSRREVVALVAFDGGILVGGLVAYVLDKLEQERSEIYIYDLAVVETRRRQGIATVLIEKLQMHAAEMGAWVIFVQADYGDDPAVALYDKLGTREEVMHFDIAPQATR